MSKSSLLKNARNYAEYLRKKERGPVKVFFHITKNENVPAIEQFRQLGPGDIKSLKNYKAYNDIVKDKGHPTWQELIRVIMRINAETGTP